MALTKAHNRMISGSVVNVIDFGASPSASGAVNAAAIQAAIDSVELNNTGIVYFPAGNYEINAGLQRNRQRMDRGLNYDY